MTTGPSRTNATPRHDGRSLISLVLPVYNEEENVNAAYEALCEMFRDDERYDIEFIFADNHSEDRTFNLLEEIAAADKRVKVIRYNRNYGFQRSLMTAYRHARGDAAIQIDCDLQDPPSLIPQFLDMWEQGHDVVVGLRRRRQEGALLTFSRRTFYALLNKISEDEITPDAGDFRLISRSVLDQLSEINDVSPYVRGITSALAANLAAIPYDRVERQRGASKFNLFRLVAFGMNGIIGHSLAPLRLAVYVGVIVAVLTFLLSLFYLIGGLVSGEGWPSGFATTTVLLLLGLSLNAIFLGIIGEYVGRIYQQIRQTPLTVIERAINLAEN